MKKLSFFTLLLLCAILSLNADDIPENEDNLQKEKKFSFQIKPFSYLSYIITFGSKGANNSFFPLHVEFQYALNNKTNISIEPYLTNKQHYDENITYYNYGTIAGLLYRPKGNWLKGFYTGAYTVIGFSNVEYKGVTDTLFNIGIMGEIGYQWVFKGGFTLALGGGIGNTWLIPFPGNIGKHEHTRALPNYPFDILTRISIGYSF
jgi:hypothetical protein